MPAQTVSFTVNADTVCQDSCITLINTSTGPVDSIRWVVYGDTAAIPHHDTITVCFPSAGIDSVRLYVYDTGRIDSATRTVHVNPAPHPKNLYLAPNVCCDVVDSYLSYQWYESEGPTMIPGATHNSYEAGMGGWYVVVDSGGCLGRSNTLWVSEGVNNITTPDIKIHLFPNPATNELSITATADINSIIISNLTGQTIFHNTYKTEDVQINVADLPKGVYFVKVNGSEVRKFVKE